MVICLERGADLHMAQLMPLPLTVSCFSEIQIGFTFLLPAHPVSPEKGPLNGCVCVFFLSVFVPCRLWCLFFGRLIVYIKRPRVVLYHQSVSVCVAGLSVLTEECGITH